MIRTVTKEEIYQKVSAILVEALSVDEEEVRPAADLRKNLGAIPIDFLEIAFRLEREFGIKIPRQEFELAPEVSSTVEAVCSYVESKLAARA